MKRLKLLTLLEFRWHECVALSSQDLCCGCHEKSGSTSTAPPASSIMTWSYMAFLVVPFSPSITDPLFISSFTFIVMGLC